MTRKSSWQWRITGGDGEILSKLSVSEGFFTRVFPWAHFYPPPANSDESGPGRTLHQWQLRAHFRISFRVVLSGVRGTTALVRCGSNGQVVGAGSRGDLPFRRLRHRRCNPMALRSSECRLLGDKRTNRRHGWNFSYLANLRNSRTPPPARSFSTPVSLVSS